MGETNIRNKEKEREDVCGRGGTEWDGDNRHAGTMMDGVCRGGDSPGSNFPMTLQK